MAHADGVAAMHALPVLPRPTRSRAGANARPSCVSVRPAAAQGGVGSHVHSPPPPPSACSAEVAPVQAAGRSRGQRWLWRCSWPAPRAPDDRARREPGESRQGAAAQFAISETTAAVPAQSLTPLTTATDLQLERLQHAHVLCRAKHLSRGECCANRCESLRRANGVVNSSPASGVRMVGRRQQCLGRALHSKHSG